LKKFS